MKRSLSRGGRLAEVGGFERSTVIKESGEKNLIGFQIKKATKKQWITTEMITKMNERGWKK